MIVLVGYHGAQKLVHLNQQSSPLFADVQHEVVKEFVGEFFVDACALQVVVCELVGIVDSPFPVEEMSQHEKATSMLLATLCDFWFMVEVYEVLHRFFVEVPSDYYFDNHIGECEVESPFPLEPLLLGVLRKGDKEVLANYFFAVSDDIVEQRVEDPTRYPMCKAQAMYVEKR